MGSDYNSYRPKIKMLEMTTIVVSDWEHIRLGKAVLVDRPFVILFLQPNLASLADNFKMPAINSVFTHSGS